MRKHGLKTAIFLLLVLSVFNHGMSEELFSGEVSGWEEGWLRDSNGYARGLDEYLNSNKAMVVYIYTDWCPYCGKFEKGVLSSPAVKKFLKNKVKVYVNPEHGNREMEIARKYGVRGFPSFIVHPAGNGRASNLRTDIPPSRFIHMLKEIEKTAVKNAGKKQKNLRGKEKNFSDKVVSKVSNEEIVPDTIIYLKHGREIKGKMVSENEKEIRIKIQDMGVVVFGRNEIDSIGTI